MRYCVACLLILASPAFVAAQETWPQFRGPGAAGVGDAPGLPATWSATESVAWKIEVPGRGWSSPIVWGERIFLTSAVKEDGTLEEIQKGLYFKGERETPAEPHRWMVYAIDLKTGETLWKEEAHRGVPAHSHHLKNTFASETPVTDGERVYAYFGNVGLFCYSVEGEPLWNKELGTYRIKAGWGTAASPVLHGDRIYVVHDNEEKSFLVAFDKRTGEAVWRVDRDEPSNWATPFVWQNEQRTELVVAGTRKVRSYSLDGTLLWELGGMSSLVIPTPFAGHGLLYITSGYILDSKKPLFAIRPGATGDISLGDDETTNEYIAWSQKQAGPYNPSPILYGDHIYVLYDRGFFACYDAKTGEEVYEKQRMGGDARAFTSSPWAYDGKIFCLNEYGKTFVIKAGPQFEVIGTNDLDEFCMATPAIAQGSVLIRTETGLYRIAEANPGIEGERGASAP